MTKRKYKRVVSDKYWDKLKKVLKRPKRQVKDIVFRLIFGNNKKALLELYNALNGTYYTNENDLQIVTLESAIYIGMKNDLAFILSGRINLYEHQSTVNPNMPLRFLIYLAEEYQVLIETLEQSIYGRTLITLPTPQCVVFYNGIEEMADEQREAMNEAIDYCIENGILEEILRKNRSEILGSLLEDFDQKKYERTIRAEGYGSGQKAERNRFISYMILEGKTDSEIISIVECTQDEIESVRKHLEI